MKRSLASSVLRSNFDNLGGNLEFAHEICMDLVILTLCTLCQVVLIISNLFCQIPETVFDASALIFVCRAEYEINHFDQLTKKVLIRFLKTLLR